MSQSEDSGGAFAGGVVVVFATQVFGAGIGIFNGIVLARALGPALKGDYYLLTMLPATAMVLLQLGLPQAFSYFSARGQTIGLVRRSFLLGGGLAAVGLAGLALMYPLLSGGMLKGIDGMLVLIGALALPLALHATFTTAIVTGRKAVRWYAAINSLSPILWLVMMLIVLVGLRLALPGAIAIYVIATLIQAAGFAIGARRVTAAVAEPRSTTVREMLRYGLKLYPASITGFFSYRADVFLLAILLVDAAAPLGWYSMAVGLAEMVFFFPNAVALLFFPHVAGSARETADEQVAQVSRVTLLITAAVGVVLAPAATLLIFVVLPAYTASLVPLFVLLPGVVALSVAKVVVGYVSGIGRPGVTSSINIVALASNIVLNLLLIPMFGIVGAAAASLISYSFNAVALTVFAARSSRQSFAAFWLPRPADARFAIVTGLAVARRMITTARVMARRPA